MCFPCGDVVNNSYDLVSIRPIDPDCDRRTRLVLLQTIMKREKSSSSLSRVAGALQSSPEEESFFASFTFKSSTRLVLSIKKKKEA